MPQSPRPSAHDSLRREQVHFVFNQSWSNIIVSPIGALLATTMAWGKIPAWKLLAWTAVMFLTAAVRFAVQKAFPQEEMTDRRLLRWEMALGGSIVLAAFWWGLGSLLLLPTDQLDVRLAFFALLMMMTSGACLSYSMHPGLAVFTVMSMGLPVIYTFFRTSERTQFVLAIAGTLLLYTILKAVNRLSALFVQAHTLSHKLDVEREELLQVNLTLEESYRELERVENLRESLSQMIVHDLRTPLASSLFYIEFVKDSLEDSNDEGHENLAKLGGILSQMNTMVENILDVARLEQDSLQLHIAQHDLAEIVEPALEKLGPMVDRIHIQESDQNVLIKCDAELISRVVLNLLTNALRYSPTGEKIEVEIDVNKGSLGVCVSDRGKGVPTEYQETIFEKFSSLDKNGHRSKGLGLAFCKLVVESHGGEISVSSKTGEPTRFRFEIPL